MAEVLKDLYYNTNNRIHPLKFALWVAMASITMMFGAFTSAYIVRQAQGNWLEFSLPNIFFVSTVILLISSLTLHTSYRAFIAEHESRFKQFLVLSLFLGAAFIVLQYLGWMQLYSVGIDLKGNPAGSFIYVISGVHALHIVGGIAAILVGILNAFTLKFKVTERRKINFELTLQYWHFVDLLWVYLLIFLYISKT